MRLLHPPTLLLLLSSFTALSSAVPLAPAATNHGALTRRAQYCANAPGTVAGTRLPARALPLPLAPTPNTPARALPAPIVWCVPDSRTYLIILIQSRMPSVALLQFLNDAYNVLTTHIAAAGDGVIPTGRWGLEVNGIGMTTINTNNHQQTYGVLGAAVEGLSHYFFTHQDMGGALYFYIFDGGVEVGQGSLGPL